ncbi:hypothetical protein GCM10023319_44250 [Nocardia iowensis]
MVGRSVSNSPPYPAVSRYFSAPRPNWSKVGARSEHGWNGERIEDARLPVDRTRVHAATDGGPIYPVSPHDIRDHRRCRGVTHDTALIGTATSSGGTGMAS